MGKVLQNAGLKILPSVSGFYLASLKFNFVNKPDYKKNAVYIFWHSKMFAGWYIFKDMEFLSLVSQSKDGDILNKLLTKWNYLVARGSSTRGGKQALTTLINKLQNGNSAVLTPDGPKGPAHEIKNGALILSKESRLPIIPIKISYSKKKIFAKSWDKFELPLPFTKVTVSFGSEHYYDEFLQGEELENFKNKLASEM